MLDIIVEISCCKAKWENKTSHKAGYNNVNDLVQVGSYISYRQYLNTSLCS